MAFDEVVKIVAEKIHKTERPTALVVRSLFSSLDLTQEDIRTLAMEGLTTRVNAFLTSGKFQTDIPKPNQISIPVRYSASESAKAAGNFESTEELPAPVRISVDVQILHNTRFEVYGVRKSIIDFTAGDLNYMLNRYAAEINGYTQRSDVFQYAKDRLATLKKDRISDLAVGEQSILARKWKTATSFTDSAAAD